MRDKKNISIPRQAFPSTNTKDSVKATEEYGLKIGKAIQHEWFQEGGGTCKFFTRWTDFHNTRLYARGEQPIQKYKKGFGEDLSHINMDWTPVPIIPKFVDIVVNGMSDRTFSTKARAVDAMSADERNKYQQMVKSQMIAKPVLMAIKENFGVDTFKVPPDELPETNDELSLFMQMKYKPRIEIAEETAIDTIFELNNYDNLRDKFHYDLTTLGIGIGKHTFNINDGIRIEYVDPATVVHSYTESPTFSDCFYWGEVKTVHVSELLKLDPDMDEEELEEAVRGGQEFGDYYIGMAKYRESVFQKDTVTLLYFNYKTTNSIVHKKKKLNNGGEKVVKKDDSFNPEPNENFEKLDKKIEVWYEGVMTLGSNMLIKWELCKNMVRPDAAIQKTYSNYVACAPRIYKGEIESLTKRMIPFADLIQMTHLKLQQVLSRIVPDGVFIDADGINEVDLGNGGSYTPEDALNMYFTTGSVIGRSYTQDGELNHGKIPIQELNSNNGQGKINSLTSTYNHYLGMIRDVTGLNEARDASTPDPNSLVGLQKLAAANSNTATRHILNASVYITKMLSEAISYRIADVLEYSDNREEFAMQIGKYNYDMLDEIKALPLHSFGIFLEVSPDSEQENQLENNIGIALKVGQINLEDAIDIRNMKNIKLANELLKQRRKSRDKQRMDEQKQAMEQQTQGNIQSAQASSQAKAQSLQIEAQVKMQVIQAQSQADMAKMEREAQLKLELMNQEFEMQMRLKQAEIELVNGRDMKKEEAKDNRTKIQATQQSKLIEQRQNKASAVDFESNEDSLDGFSLGEFEPR